MHDGKREPVSSCGAAAGSHAAAVSLAALHRRATGADHLGGLFLAHNLGWRFPVWHWFGHWWPLLLIVWGVVVLLERMRNDGAGCRSRGRGIGAGGIMLLILIVVLGVSAHHTSDFNWSGVRDQMQMDDDDMGSIFGGTAYTFEDTLEHPFPAHGSLRVVCDRGALNISPSDGDTIRVVVHKKLYAAESEGCRQVQRRYQAANHGDRAIRSC